MGLYLFLPSFTSTRPALHGQLYSDGVPGSSRPQPSPFSSRRGVPVVEWKDPSSSSQQSAMVVPSTVLKTMTTPKTDPFSPRPVAPPTAVPQTPEQILIRPVQVTPPVQVNHHLDVFVALRNVFEICFTNKMYYYYFPAT